MRLVRSLSACLPLLAALLLPGCESMLHSAGAPAANVAFEIAAPQGDPIENGALPAPGELAAQRAASFAGIRYRFGGTSPSEGFDCSGLIHFSYREAAGVKLPRDTGSLRNASLRIDRHELRPGDLIFFRLRGSHGHVGIYAGEGRFIHAPSRGKKVRFESLDAPFWQKKLAETRRPIL